MVTRKINENYVFVYNSLYINSRILRIEDLNKIQDIRNLTEEECLERLDRNAFMEFMKLKYIVESNTDERATLQEELQQRKQKF